MVFDHFVNVNILHFPRNLVILIIFNDLLTFISRNVVILPLSRSLSRSTTSRQLPQQLPQQLPRQLRSQILYEIADFGTRQRCSKISVKF